MPTVSLGVGECYCFQGGVREAVRSLLKLHFSMDGAERDFTDGDRKLSVTSERETRSFKQNHQHNFSLAEKNSNKLFS